MNDLFKKMDENNKLLWNEVKDLEVLKAQDEIRLAEDMRIYVNNDKNCDSKEYRKSYKAYEKLYKHNIKLVFKIASNYEGRGLMYDDLVQEGLLGLQTGLKKYDYTLGHRVSTYVSNWIAQSIGRAIEKNRSVVRIPGHAHQKYREIIKCEEELANQLMKEPTVEEIALKLEIDVLDVITYKSIYSNTYQLDSKVNANGDTFIDLTPDTNGLDNFKLIEENEKRYYLNKFIETLDDKGKAIINEYYQLDETKRKLTLKDISFKFNCSREYIRQYKLKTIDKLKHYIVENNLTDIYADYIK